MPALSHSFGNSQQIPREWNTARSVAGHGLAILPTYLCGPALARGTLKTVFDDLEPVSSIGRHLYACYTPNRVRVPKVRVFLAELEETFNPVPPWEKA
jgi:DNA-binding transcriptional LysR family regulator